MHFGGSNPACVHFGGSAGYDLSGSGCQTTSSSSEPQFTWGISRIRSFWFRMQNQFQYFRAASFNPFVSTTTPPYYSLTTYHLRQIYASTVALKTALKRRWLRRLTPTSNTYEQIGTITVQGSTVARCQNRSVQQLASTAVYGNSTAATVLLDVRLY